jgi:hypothetical protein
VPRTAAGDRRRLPSRIVPEAPPPPRHADDAWASGPRKETPLKAVASHGRLDVRADSVPYPSIAQPTDAVIRITGETEDTP